MPAADLADSLEEDVSELPVLRALVRCAAEVGRVACRNIEGMGLTPPQFDVLATLGDLPGLTCSQLGERTFITRGTLVPVLDRLEAKGLVQRSKGTVDSRQTIVSLTPAGQALYERTFEPHIAFMRPLLDGLAAAEQQQLIGLLNKLEGRFAEETARQVRERKRQR